MLAQAGSHWDIRNVIQDVVIMKFQGQDRGLLQNRPCSVESQSNAGLRTST